MNKIKNIIQSLLRLKGLRKSLHFFLFITYSIFSRFIILPLAFFTFFPSFWREQRAVLRGFSDYYKNSLFPRKSIALLRRNIHRLEKGLVMRPMRKTFAVNYIGETVEYLNRFLSKLSPAELESNSDTLGWAQSVLDKYYSLVDISHPVIAKSQAQYLKSREKLLAHTTNTETPRERSSYETVNIEYEDFYRLTKTRRSVRWYQNKRVPRELIEKAMLAAIQSPSACNRLPYEFRLFDDPKLIQKVAKLPMGTAGYAENIPALAVIVGKLNYYFSPRDRHLIYIDSSLAAMSFMLACETLGLSTCPINWPDFELLEQKMSRILKLKAYERPIMLVSIGYADPEGLIPASVKKETHNFLRWND